MDKNRLFKKLLTIPMAIVIAFAGMAANAGNGSGSSPFIEKVWDIYINDTGQGMPVDSVSPVPPRPGEERIMLKCMAVCDNDGKDDIKDVQAWVLMPAFSGCKNFALSAGGACEATCLSEGTNSTACMACILQQCPTENFSKEHEIFPDALTKAENGSQEFEDCMVQAFDPELLNKTICNLYTGSFSMNYTDVSGNYSILVMTADTNDSIGFSENIFPYGECAGIEINPSSIDFGQIKPGETKDASGMAIRNICNTPIDIEQSHTDMTGLLKGDIIPAGSITGSINNGTNTCPDINLMAGSSASATARLVVPLGILPDTYTGTMTFAAKTCS